MEQSDHFLGGAEGALQEYLDIDCPVCGVPYGYGGCHRCLAIACVVFEQEDYMDEL